MDVTKEVKSEGLTRFAFLVRNHASMLGAIDVANIDQFLLAVVLDDFDLVMVTKHQEKVFKLLASLDIL